MQSLSLPTTNLPLPSNAASVTSDTMTSNSPGDGDFSKVLARELAGKTYEHEAGVENPDSSTTAPLADSGTLQLPPDPASVTAALLALMPEIQPNELYQPQQIADEARAAALPNQIPGEALTTALSDQIPGEALTTALSDQIPAAALAAVLPSQIPNEVLAAALPNQIADETLTAALPNSIPNGVLPAALQTAASTQRNVLQEAQEANKLALGSDKAALGSGRTASESNRAASVSDKTANFAALDKFLPPVATDDKISLVVTPPVAQDSVSATPLPQMGNSPMAVTTPPISASAPTDQGARLNARVGTPNWDGALSQKVVWMVTQQQQVAQLQLNPPNLGPMEVMLTIGDDKSQANIQFTSPHLAVREAIEAALPRLREMMADSGLSLGSATVSADSFQQQAQSGRQDQALGKQGNDISQIASELAPRSTTTHIHSGLVDTFA